MEQISESLPFSILRTVHHPVSYKTIEELDKGGVELVWVAAKREDADRKLGLRISQEMHVLRDHANTTFVIISSDQDFRHHMQVLMNAGYTVIIIHNSPPGNWTKSLEMCATAAYHWDRDVLEKDSLNTNQTSDDETLKRSSIGNKSLNVRSHEIESVAVSHSNKGNEENVDEDVDTMCLWMRVFISRVSWRILIQTISHLRQV